MSTSSINNLASHVNASALTLPQPTQDQKALIQAVKAVNAAELFGQDNELTFTIDRVAKLAVARVVNKITGKVIRQISNEDVLKLAEENNGR